MPLNQEAGAVVTIFKVHDQVMQAGLMTWFEALHNHCERVFATVVPALWLCPAARRAVGASEGGPGRSYAGRQAGGCGSGQVRGITGDG